MFPNLDIVESERTSSELEHSAHEPRAARECQVVVRTGIQIPCVPGRNDDIDDIVDGIRIQGGSRIAIEPIRCRKGSP